MKNKYRSNFLHGLRESYKFFFYKVLLNHSHDTDSIEGIPLDTIVFEMVVEAWPYVSRGLSLGSSDQLEIICKAIAKGGEDSDVLPIEVVQAYVSTHGDEVIKDVYRVFARFADAWIGRTVDITTSWLHSQKHTSDKDFPYYLGCGEQANALFINSNWQEYINRDFNHSVEHANSSLVEFVSKRNRNKKGVHKIMKEILWMQTPPSPSHKTENQTPVHSVEGISDLDFTKLENIPIDFILSHDPRIIEGSMGSTYLRSNPQADITHVGDLFKISFRKRSAIQTLRDYVFKHHERIIAAFDYYNERPIIPQEIAPGMPLGISLRMFVHEYVDRLSTRNSILCEKEREKRNVRLKIFTSMFDDRDSDIASKAGLAEELGLHPERIRQLQKGTDTTIGIESCSQILNGYIQSEDFIVNPLLQYEYITFSASGFVAERRETFDSQHVFLDQKTRAFFLATQGLYDTDTIRYIEPFIIKGENITIVNRCMAIVMKFFNDKVNYISLESDLVPHLKQNTSLEYEVIDVICGIVKHSEIFESINPSGEQLYRLKWQNLLTIPCRMARILADAGVPMHYSAVFEEYNARANQYGLSTDMYSEFAGHPPRHASIAVKGKTGVWEYAVNATRNDASSDSLMSMVEQIIIKNDGKISEKEVIDSLIHKGVECKPRTVRTYITQFCWISHTDPSIFVHKDYIQKYPELDARPYKVNDYHEVIPIVLRVVSENGGTATIRQVTEGYISETGNSIRDSSMRLMLAKCEHLLAQERVGRNVILRLLVPIDEIDNIDIDSELDNSSPKYYGDVRDAVIHMLEQSPEGCLKMSVVVKELRSIIPADRHKNVIYKILSKMNGIEIYQVDGKNFLRLGR